MVHKVADSNRAENVPFFGIYFVPVLVEVVGEVVEVVGEVVEVTAGPISQLFWKVNEVETFQFRVFGRPLSVLSLQSSSFVKVLERTSSTWLSVILLRTSRTKR